MILLYRAGTAWLSVWTKADHQEDELLAIDERLRLLRYAGGLLVTYGGDAQDPIVRHRAARHVLCVADGLLGWRGNTTYADLLVQDGGGASPRDLAAGLGVPAGSGWSKRDAEHASGRRPPKPCSPRSSTWTFEPSKRDP